MRNGLELGVDFETLENDDPVVAFNHHDFRQDGENVTVLGKGSRDNVKFEWVVTPWTECSQSCGSEVGYRVSEFPPFVTYFFWGIQNVSILTFSFILRFLFWSIQSRKANCMVRLHNTTNTVDNVLCEDAGLSLPETVEKCGGGECARWVTGEWTLCLRSRCLSLNQAAQNRNVQCQFTNGSDSNSCDESDKPITRQNCYNERCRHVWKVGEWSEVSF